MLVTLASIFFYGAAGRDGGRRGTGAERWGSGEPGGGGWGRMVSLRPVPARCLRGAWPRGWLRLRAVRLPAVRAGLCTGSLPRPAAPRRRHVPMQRARTGTKPHGRQGSGGARACWRAAACRPTRSASAGRCCCVSLWGVRTGASVASEAEKRCRRRCNRGSVATAGECRAEHHLLAVSFDPAAHGLVCGTERGRAFLYFKSKKRILFL